MNRSMLRFSAGESNHVIAEESAMAVVVHKGKILAIKEMIFGKVTISLPKGHTEENETAL